MTGGFRDDYSFERKGLSACREHRVSEGPETDTSRTFETGGCQAISSSPRVSNKVTWCTLPGALEAWLDDVSGAVSAVRATVPIVILVPS